MDTTDFPYEVMASFYRDLARIHQMLGTVDSIVKKLRNTRSVLDIGCGHGAVLAGIRDALGTRVIGVDLKAPASNPYGVEILAGDATRDALPQADTAICLFTAHHLTEQQVVDLIRNVGRSCDRLIILDLVRHSLPLVLFRVFMGPMLDRIVMLDGVQSIRRAYTGPELAALAHRALAGTGARCQHCVSPFYSNQTLDITYRPGADLAAGRPSKDRA